MSKPQECLLLLPIYITPSSISTVELPKRQFGIRDQSHILAFDGNSMVSFLTASQSQSKHNLPVKVNDGAN